MGQKNLVNTDKILLFKHTLFIPISLQPPLSLQSFLAMPAPACRQLLFEHSTFFFLGCLHVAVLLFQSCFHLLFSSFSLLASQVPCTLPSFFNLPNELALVYICPRSFPFPASSRKRLIGVSCLGSPM